MFHHNIPKGQSIKANGYVIDTVKKKRLSGVKIYLMGGTNYENLHSGGWSWNIALDSTITDINGNYNFNDIAEGSSEDYALSIEKFTRTNGSGVTDDEYPVCPFNSDGSSPIISEHLTYELNNKTIYARELNFCKIHVKMSVNDFDTIVGRVYNGSRWDVYFLVIGKKVDTTILLKCLVPERMNYIDYDLTEHQLLHSTDSDSHEIELKDSIFPHISDTAVLEENLKLIYNLNRK